VLLSTLSVVVKTVGVSEAVAGLTRLDAAGKKSATTMTAAESGMGKASRAAGLLTLGVGAAAAGAVKLAADFQSSMNQLQAVTGASTKTMNAMRKEAIRLGADTRLPATSAKDAAEAMTEMVKAGVSVTDTMGGVRDVLILSAAAQVSNARAAEIASNAMNAFHLAGRDVKMITDQLANTANASSVEINDVADSFKMAAAVFSGFQGPAIGAKNAMTELNVAIGILGNAGIKGSDAGTSLKQMLLQLTGPSNRAKGAMQALYIVAQGGIATSSELTNAIQGGTKARDAAVGAIMAHNKSLADGGDIAYDASGKMRSLKDIIALVTAGTKDMTAADKNAYLTQIFGADATRAVISLMNAGPGAFDKMTAAVTKQGSAQALAESKMKGFNGAMESLKSAGETLAITLGTTLLPALTTFVQFLSRAAGVANQEHVATMILIGGLTALAAGVWIVNAAMAANPATLWIAGLVALGAAVVVAYNHFAVFRTVVNAVFAWLVATSAQIATTAGAAPHAIAAAWTSATSTIVGEISQWDLLWSAIKRGLDFIVATARVAMAGLKVIFSVGLLALAPIATAAFTLFKAVFTSAFQAIRGIVTGGLQAIRGVILVFGGLFKGDFTQIWTGVKTIFSGGIRALRGILAGAWTILKAPVDAIGAGLHDAFSNSWDRIKTVFRSAINAVIDFMNVLIRAVNSLPMVPDITPIANIGGGGGGGGGRAGSNIPANKLARGGAFARTGGYVNQPITLMGEEAPLHPEFVIPSNPRYRERARGLLGQAAQALGFAAGGVSQYNRVYPRHIGPNPRFTTFTPEIVASIASSVGLPGTTFAQIARGESGYQPGVQQRDPGDGMVGYGLWQNTPNAWGQGAARQYFDRLGGIPQMFNPVTNALMARFLYQAAGNSISPWHGTRFVTDGGGGGLGPVTPAVDVAGMLPHVTAGMGIFQGLGKYLLGKAGAFIRDHVIAPVTSLVTGGPSKPQPGMPGYGVSGVGEFMGLPMAKWVIEALQYAQSKGVTVRPTSGYRPGFDPHTASGRSEHQGTQYPHGAVDFGGYNTGGAMKMAVVNATRDFKWPLLAPIGFHDEGHASGTGHAKGGVFKYLGAFGAGGFTGAQEGLAYLHKNEAVVPMAKGGTIRHGKGSVKVPTLPHRGSGPLIVDTRIFGKTPAPRAFNDPDPSDTGAGDGGSNPLIDAMDRQTAAIEEQTRIDNLIHEQQAIMASNQQRILAMAQQGDKLVAAVVAAVNGGIGGSAGLGFQSPSYAGGMARYK
jgi:TP901 family phage tail tape measure protein